MKMFYDVKQIFPDGNGCEKSVGGLEVAQRHYSLELKSKVLCGH